jgi:multicomponent Na+:H+ antiporter subunit A
MIHRSFILDVLIDLIVRTALVFSAFLLFSGHNSPGGGFVAGLVFGISLLLMYVAGGSEKLQTLLPLRPEALLGTGLFIALMTGVAGFVWGDAFLESTYVELDLPVLGVMKLTSALVFDIGVFAVVIGLVATLILTLAPTDGAR